MFRDNKEDRKQKISNKDVLRLYFRIRKQRLILSLIVCTFTIILMVSIMFSWNSYKITSFKQYLDENGNWYNDKKVILNAFGGSDVVHIDYNYLNDLSSYIVNGINRNTLDGIVKDHTSLQSIMLLESLNNPFFSIELFDNYTYELLEEGLIEGRMPANSLELVYFKESNDNGINLNDNLTLFATDYYVGPKQTFQVVGIIENLTSVFTENEKSIDILDWEDNYVTDSSYLNIEIASKLFSTPEFFYSLFSEFSETYPYGYTLIDIEYDNSIISNKKLPKIITRINHYINDPITGISKIHYNDLYPSKNLQIEYTIDWCQQLNSLSLNYKEKSLHETARIIAILVPTISLLFFLIFEILGFDKKTLRITYQKFNSFGFNIRTIGKLVSIENLVLVSLSLVIGIILSLICGPLLNIILGINLTFSTYITAISNPLNYILLTIYLSFVFIASYFYQTKLAKETIIDRSKQTSGFKEKFRDFATKFEVRILVIGLILQLIGILLLFLSQMVIDIMYNYKIYQSLFGFSLVLLSSGFLLEFFLVLSILSKLFTLIISKISELQWHAVKRNKLSLILKEFSVNRKEYHRMFMILMLFSICFLPGILINDNLNNYANFEHSLELGCCDIKIINWEYNNSLYNEINTIDGIESTTIITNYVFEFEGSYHNILPELYGVVNVLAIHNSTSFIETVNLELCFGETNNVIADIQNLSRTNSYLLTSLNLQNKLILNQYNLTNSDVTGNANYEYDMNYINSYDYFPAAISNYKKLSKGKVLYDYEFDIINSFGIITSRETANTLKYFDPDTLSSETGSILVKTSNGANNTEIINNLTNLGLEPITASNLIAEKDFQAKYISFILILNAVIITVVILFIGFTTAWNIYSERLDLTETYYRIGLNKLKIWFNFFLEITLVSLVPIIISVPISIYLIEVVSKFLLRNTIEYHTFTLDLHWWFIIVSIIVQMVLLQLGWNSILAYKIKQYKPIKQV